MSVYMLLVINRLVDQAACANWDCKRCSCKLPDVWYESKKLLLVIVIYMYIFGFYCDFSR